jgi:hypothetical protein
MLVHSSAFLQSNWFKIFCYGPQSRQRTRLFLQSSKLGLLPTLSPAGECVPSPLWAGGTHSLAGEGVLIPTRGQTLWHSRYICTLWHVPLIVYNLAGYHCLAGWDGYSVWPGGGSSHPLRPPAQVPHSTNRLPTRLKIHMKIHLLFHEYIMVFTYCTLLKSCK